jgi:hypothetical protein
MALVMSFSQRPGVFRTSSGAAAIYFEKSGN